MFNYDKSRIRTKVFICLQRESIHLAKNEKIIYTVRQEGSQFLLIYSRSQQQLTNSICNKREKKNAL